MKNMGISDFEKKIVRMGVNLVSRKLKKSAIVREDCLRTTTNKPIRALNNLVLIASGKLKAPFQAETTKIFGQFALWIFLKDTAYRDIFFWTLYRILKMADKLLPLIEPYVKEPKDWYPNQWIDGIDDTNRKRKAGKIPVNEKSQAEKMFVPELQDERFRKL